MTTKDRAYKIALRLKPAGFMAIPAMTIETFIRVVSLALREDHQDLIDKTIMRIRALASHEGHISVRRRAIEDAISVLEEMRDVK